MPSPRPHIGTGTRRRHAPAAAAPSGASSIPRRRGPPTHPQQSTPAPSPSAILPDPILISNPPRPRAGAAYVTRPPPALHLNICFPPDRWRWGEVVTKFESGIANRHRDSMNPHDIHGLSMNMAGADPRRRPGSSDRLRDKRDPRWRSRAPSSGPMEAVTTRRPAAAAALSAALLAVMGCSRGPVTAPSGAAPTRPEIANLHAFARLYGVVRWFHPSDSAAVVDWDRFALDGVHRVIDAPDATALRARPARDEAGRLASAPGRRTADDRRVAIAGRRGRGSRVEVLERALAYVRTGE